MYIYTCIRYLLINDVFVNYLGVDLQCALSSIDCHNFTVICTSRGTFNGFSLQKQCLNDLDFVNCTYLARDGKCYRGDCARCPTVAANLNMIVVEFQMSNDKCTINISTIDIQGFISNSSAVGTSNCKFMYTCMCIFLFLGKTCLLIHVHVYKGLPTI